MRAERSLLVDILLIASIPPTASKGSLSSSCLSISVSFSLFLSSLTESDFFLTWSNSTLAWANNPLLWSVSLLISSILPLKNSVDYLLSRWDDCPLKRPSTNSLEFLLIFLLASLAFASATLAWLISSYIVGVFYGLGTGFSWYSSSTSSNIVGTLSPFSPLSSFFSSC